MNIPHALKYFNQLTNANHAMSYNAQPVSAKRRRDDDATQNEVRFRSSGSEQMHGMSSAVLQRQLPSPAVDFNSGLDKVNAKSKSRKGKYLVSMGSTATNNVEIVGFFQRIVERTEESRRVGLASRWIERCHQQHPLCRPHRQCSFIPRRLIDVMGRRLIDTQGQCRFKYAALTHCWGPQMPEAGMTKIQTLPSRRENIDFSALPKSFRDALLIARCLKIPYIWIDSLCIIQDSMEDWETESAQMGLVYSAAWCTIAASSAESCHDGIYLTRKEGPPLCQFIVQDVNGFRVQFSLFESSPKWESFYNSNPLNKRGWTFQERELSPRVLHFSTDQMWWECRTLRTQEDLPREDEAVVYPQPLPKKKKVKIARPWEKPQFVEGAPEVNSAVQLRCLDNMLQIWNPSMESSVIHRFIVREARYNTWHKMVQDYTARTFTRITDRFPALSGLVSEMQAAHGGEYAAGLWRDDLPRSLLWRRYPSKASPSNGPFTRPQEYRAPSWSWAAVDERVTYDLVTVYRPQIDTASPMTAHIEDISLTPEGSDVRGRLKDGCLNVRGRVKPYRPSNLFGDGDFHFDFDNDADDNPLWILSLFAKLSGGDISLTGIASGLVLVMIEDAEDTLPVFRRIGVVGNIPTEWFNDGMDVKIKII